MRKDVILRGGAVFVLLLALAGTAEGQGGGFGGGGFGGGGYVFRERMKRDRPADFQLLQKVKQSEIVVVRGSHDHVETVLSYVRVPHLTIDPEDLDDAELNAGQLLLTVLRISPALDSGKAGQLKEGTLVKPLDKRGEWWRVRSFVGDEGWVRSENLKAR